MPDTPLTDLQAKLLKLRRDGEERAAQRLAEKLNLPYADLSKMPVSLDAVKVVPEEDARNGKAAVIQVRAEEVALVTVNPELPATKKVIRDLESKHFQVKVFVVSPSSLNSAFHFYKFIKPQSEDITGTVMISKNRLEELKARLTTLEAIKKEFEGLNFAKTSPVDVIQIILAGALAVRASDIHTEAGEKMAKIRLRVDGLLHDAFDNMPLRPLYENFASRIKLLAGMKLNVHDEAQDGRFTINLAGREVEMRVSVIPAEFGETIVMRILDPQATMVGLEQLGLRPDNMELVKRELERPNGAILNTGPTGSGKTTTLYAFLRTINDPTLKIITLEDPIEYRIEGIEQTQVDEEAGYTFANGLRAIVRQDPDVILVGEIRDLETADIAMQAALTGHLVFSTLHTNDAVGAVPRLINLGVKAVSIGPALALVIAQRLVRVLCPDCKKEAPLDLQLNKKIGQFLEKLPERVNRGPYKDFKIFDPVGCEKCSGIGYRGRIGIFEFLEGGPGLEQVILQEASEVALRNVAKDQGMVTMQQDGILKALLGETTLEEVKSVTGELEW
ncbi:MAG: type II/IV secretion system protein [Patescibacteria group bacterium]|nr:type II/IV secretion system protein [Patescibacteria group bacterium]